MAHLESTPSASPWGWAEHSTSRVLRAAEHQTFHSRAGTNHAGLDPSAGAKAAEAEGRQGMQNLPGCCEFSRMVPHKSSVQINQTRTSLMYLQRAIEQCLMEPKALWTHRQTQKCERWAAACRHRAAGPDTAQNTWPVKTQLIHLLSCRSTSTPKLSVAQLSSQLIVSSQQISLPQAEFSASNLQPSSAVPWCPLAPFDPQGSCFTVLVWLILTDSVLSNTKLHHHFRASNLSF